MTRWATHAAVKPNLAKRSMPRYPVTINPLISRHPTPDGFFDLDAALSELIDEDVEFRLKEKRKLIASEIYTSKSGLKFLRLQAGFSQKQLADAIGTSQPRLSVWESNPKTISLDSARALAKELAVDYNEFFKAVFGG